MRTKTVAIMMNEDGTASMWDWNDPVFLHRAEMGESWWTSLFTPCCTKILRASAFESAMASEVIYDTQEALESWPGPLPHPIGVRASYKVTYANGRKYPAGVHPSMLKEPYDARSY
jgi:hypothetical protein